MPEGVLVYVEYLDVQETTNGHTYTMSGTHETWKKLAN